jgi:hypothetical protein
MPQPAGVPHRRPRAFMAARGGDADRYLPRLGPSSMVARNLARAAAASQGERSPKIFSTKPKAIGSFALDFIGQVHWCRWAGRWMIDGAGVS